MQQKHIYIVEFELRPNPITQVIFGCTVPLCMTQNIITAPGTKEGEDMRVCGKVRARELRAQHQH